MNFGTDLALERKEILGSDLKGVVINTLENEECKTTIIDVKTKDAAKKLQKGVGKYITIEIENFSNTAPVSDARLKTITESIGALIPKGRGTVLVAGIGNLALTSDSLGPKTANKIIATRHIGEEFQREIGFEKALTPVASVSTGVLGQTGIESGEYIKCICSVVKPKCVITIDALASGKISRLGRTIQMSNTGIAPGSGIGNSRMRIDEGLLGVPVIAIGIPTVVNALQLSSELADIKLKSFSQKSLEQGEALIVAPKDIDLIVENASYLLALSINCALQKSLTAGEIYALM